MPDKTAFNNAFKEASKYWHLACNYERVNPRSANQVTFSDNNPHLNNYRKSLAKMREAV
jgi:hypothetical protein